MNLNIPGALLLLGGLLLGYSAVSNKDPREVVRMMFTGQQPTTPISAPAPVATTPAPVIPPAQGTWV